MLSRDIIDIGFCKSLAEKQSIATPSNFMRASLQEFQLETTRCECLDGDAQPGSTRDGNCDSAPEPESEAESEAEVDADHVDL